VPRLILSGKISSLPAMMPATIARAASVGGKPVKTSAIGVRDRLLAAADRLFYREGIRAVGVDRLLAEADAAKASRYQHFGCRTSSWPRTWSAEPRTPARAARHTSPTRPVTTRAQVFRLGGGVSIDGAVAGSEVDGPQRARDARWMAKKLLAG